MQDERLRRTMMFVPGNNPAMVKDAGIYGADSIMFDLEDAVSMAEKDAARILVAEAIKTQDYGDAELVVRVNGQDTPFYRNDVLAMVKAGIEVIRLPKAESADMIKKLEQDVLEAEKKFNREIGSTHLMAAIESAKVKRLTDIKLFDVYAGANIAEGMKSMAYSLTFQNPNDNLTDEEVTKYMDKITKVLVEQLGAEVR